MHGRESRALVARVAHVLPYYVAANTTPASKKHPNLTRVSIEGGLITVYVVLSDERPKVRAVFHTIMKWYVPFFGHIPSKPVLRHRS